MPAIHAAIRPRTEGFKSDLISRPISSRTRSSKSAGATGWRSRSSSESGMALGRGCDSATLGVSRVGEKPCACRSLPGTSNRPSSSGPIPGSTPASFGCMSRPLAACVIGLGPVNPRSWNRSRPEVRIRVKMLRFPVAYASSALRSGGHSASFWRVFRGRRQDAKAPGSGSAGSRTWPFNPDACRPMVGVTILAQEPKPAGIPGSLSRVSASGGSGRATAKEVVGF